MAIVMGHASTVVGDHKSGYWGLGTQLSVKKGGKLLTV